MKSLFLISAATALILSGAYTTGAEARTGGCVKYGLGGAILGHMAGGHGVAGAAAGCAMGAYRRHNAEQGYDRHDNGYGYDRGRGDYTGTVAHQRQRTYDGY